MVDGRPRFGGSGKAVEYAVRMRRFDQCLRLDRQLEAGKLTATDMCELASVIADRHRSADRVDADLRNRVLRLTRTFMLDNWGTKIWYNGWPNGCPFFSVKSLTHLPTIALIIVNANMPKKNIVKIKTA